MGKSRIGEIPYMNLIDRVRIESKHGMMAEKVKIIGAHPYEGIIVIGVFYRICIERWNDWYFYLARDLNT